MVCIHLYHLSAGVVLMSHACYHCRSRQRRRSIAIGIHWTKVERNSALANKQHLK